MIKLEGESFFRRGHRGLGVVFMQTSFDKRTSNINHRSSNHHTSRVVCRSQQRCHLVEPYPVSKSTHRRSALCCGELTSPDRSGGDDSPLFVKRQRSSHQIINTTSKLGLPSITLLGNQHGGTRNTRQTKDGSATTKRESNTHATKPTRPQYKAGCCQFKRLWHIFVRGRFLNLNLN